MNIFWVRLSVFGVIGGGWMKFVFYTITMRDDVPIKYYRTGRINKCWAGQTAIKRNEIIRHLKYLRFHNPRILHSAKSCDSHYFTWSHWRAYGVAFTTTVVNINDVFFPCPVLLLLRVSTDLRREMHTVFGRTPKEPPIVFHTMNIAQPV